MRKAATDASPQAKDITIEHPAPPLSMESCDPHTGHVRAVQGEAASTYGMPHLWHLRQAAGSRRLIVDVVSASLERVVGVFDVRPRPDTPLPGVGIDPDAWVCLAWALSEVVSVRDADIPHLRTVGDLHRHAESRA